MSGTGGGSFDETSSRNTVASTLTSVPAETSAVAPTIPLSSVGTIGVGMDTSGVENCTPAPGIGTLNLIGLYKNVSCGILDINASSQELFNSTDASNDTPSLMPAETYPSGDKAGISYAIFA